MDHNGRISFSHDEYNSGHFPELFDFFVGEPDVGRFPKGGAQLNHIFSIIPWKY
jgi:hypothetical protein